MKPERYVSHTHLVVLNPVLQVSHGVAVVQRRSEPSQDLFFTLIQVSVDPVQFTRKLDSFAVVWRTLNGG